VRIAAAVRLFGVGLVVFHTLLLGGRLGLGWINRSLCDFVSDIVS
jgi:hypothetical protein